MAKQTKSPLERYRPFFSPDEFEHLIAELARPLPPAIRLNTLKNTTPSLTLPLEGEGDNPATLPEGGVISHLIDLYKWQVQAIPFCESGWQIEATETPPSRTLEYKMGEYFIQDAASMLPVEMFNRDIEHPLILDMAAAPGGKTTHLVSHFADHGMILANDTSKNRLAAVKANLQTWGAMGAMMTNFNGESFGDWYPNTFDKILLDAPCSGDTLRPHKGSKQRGVSAKEQDRLHHRQVGLLTSAFHALKPDGELVYSTCTLSPDENEAVIDTLLTNFPEMVQVDAINHLNLNPNAKGFTRDGEREFHPHLANAVRLFPHHYRTSGFFAVKVRKIAESQVDVTPPPHNDYSPNFLSDSDTREILQILHDELGFEFASMVDSLGLVLWDQDGYVYAAPSGLIQQFQGLPYYGMGLLIGQWMDEVFMPSHEFITRFESEIQGNFLILDTDQAKLWLGGREIRGLPIPESRYPLLLMRDALGRFIGRGKIAGNRIRNLLPKRLVT